MKTMRAGTRQYDLRTVVLWCPNLGLGGALDFLQPLNLKCAGLRFELERCVKGDQWLRALSLHDALWDMTCASQALAKVVEYVQVRISGISVERFANCKA